MGEVDDELEIGCDGDFCVLGFYIRMSVHHLLMKMNNTREFGHIKKNTREFG